MKKIFLLLLLMLTTLFATQNTRDMVRNSDLKVNGEILGKVEDFGKYYALLIGVENYTNLPKLQTPFEDIHEVAKLLENRFGFEKSMIIKDPSNRSELLDKLDDMKDRLTSKDNLLIYYAGHGSFEKLLGIGYWQLKEAKHNRRSGWVSLNEAIRNTLKLMSAKHILVVADSCHSGALARDAYVSLASIQKNELKYYSKIMDKKSRKVLTSGGMEVVLDGDGQTGEHSVFAKAFIITLKNNEKEIFSAEEIFPSIKKIVSNNADQTPEYANIRKTGVFDLGGDFVFLDYKVLKKNNETPKNTTDIVAINNINTNTILAKQKVGVSVGMALVSNIPDNKKSEDKNKERFRIISKDIVFNVKNKLYWTRFDPNKKRLLYKEASKYCKELDKGWRLPTNKEWFSIQIKKGMKLNNGKTRYVNTEIFTVPYNAYHSSDGSDGDKRYSNGIYLSEYHWEVGLLPDTVAGTICVSNTYEHISDDIKESKKFSLIINSTPSNAKIYIMNIQPKYKEGIELEKGSYKIKIVAEGYETKKFTIDLSEDFQTDVILNQKQVSRHITTIKGLMYQNQPFSKKYTWQGAKNYCQNLSLGGYSNWRLPKRRELSKLSNIKMYGTFDYNVKKWFDLNKHRRVKNSKGTEHFIRKEFVENMPKISHFWTSEVKSSPPSTATVVIFRNGVDNWYPKSYDFYALCVR